MLVAATPGALRYKQPVSVLVLVYTVAGDILLLERARHPGFWQSVTGSREGDEPLIETAARELCEETGIQATPAQLQTWNWRNRFEILPQWRERYAPDVRHNVEHVFSLCLPAPCPVQLAPDEHRQMCWLPWAVAAERVFSWTNRDAIVHCGTRLLAGAQHAFGSPPAPAST